jgi:hypothetical protein
MTTLHPVDQTVLASIRAIVDYDMATERADYERQHPDDREGHVFLHLERVAAWLADAPTASPAQFVQVVNVTERTDGFYVFADLDDAKAFETTVNGDRDVSLGSACFRTEEVVCDHADALKLIAAECEASEEAIAFSLESGVPIATRAWKKGESAPYPDKLLGVEYTVYTAGGKEDDGQRPRKRFLWVGLDPEVGAPNVDAGRERLESEGWEVTDWGAA